MASISAEPNGRKSIQLVGDDGKRRTIRLGKLPMKQAEESKRSLERLLSDLALGQGLSVESARWLAAMDDTLHSRLAASGLVKARASQRAGLKDFIDGYIDGRADLKPRTVTNLKQVEGWLVRCFGKDRNIRTIRAADAEDFRAFIAKGGLGENSIRRNIGMCRQLFRAAIRREQYQGINPFEGMSATVRSDKSR